MKTNFSFFFLFKAIVHINLILNSVFNKVLTIIALSSEFLAIIKNCELHESLSCPSSTALALCLQSTITVLHSPHPLSEV